MSKEESAAYDAYQQAKEQLADAVETMKTAASTIGYTELNIKEDIREVIENKGIDVDDWII